MKIKQQKEMKIEKYKNGCNTKKLAQSLKKKKIKTEEI